MKALFASEIILEDLIGRENISLVDLEAFPQFLRFEKVYLPYCIGSQTIGEKCELFGATLTSIKAPLNESKEISFASYVKQNDSSQFNNHTTFLSYLRDEFLPICDSSRRYTFIVWFYSDENDATKVIDSILKMPQIARCSNVVIELYLIIDPIQLPVETIAQWLNQQSDERIGLFDQKKEEKFLTIFSHQIQNVLEVRDHLKKVLFV